MPARRVGRLILVDVPTESASDAGRVVVYCRVSSLDQEGDLERQAGRVTRWVAGQGMPVSGVVTEVGSGLNGARPKLRGLLGDASAWVIAVEHRDRLARFGVEYVEAALTAQGRDCTQHACRLVL